MRRLLPLVLALLASCHKKAPPSLPSDLAFARDAATRVADVEGLAVKEESVCFREVRKTDASILVSDSSVSVVEQKGKRRLGPVVRTHLSDETGL